MNATSEAERDMALARLKGDYLLHWAYGHDLGNSEAMEYARIVGPASGPGFLPALTFLMLNFGGKQRIVPELLALRAERKEQM